MVRLICWFALILVLLSPAWGQDHSAGLPQTLLSKPSNQSPGGTDRQIIIDVQVNDRSGAPVHGLQLQDFTLLDDQQPWNIESFREVNGSMLAGDPSVEVVLVVDAVNASFEEVSTSRSWVRKFLQQNNGHLKQPVSLIVFSTHGTNIQKYPSRDGKALAALYDHYQTGLRSTPRSQGIYGAQERFGLSLKALAALGVYEAGRPGRKLVVWVSPGWPMLSLPGIQPGDQGERRLFDWIASLSSQLRRARITLYDVDPLGVEADTMRTNFYQEFLKGVRSPSQALPANLALQVIAVQTGGRVLNTSNDLTSEISNCVADAEAFYVISFTPRPTEEANAYHSLTIKVEKPGTEIRTRTGYYAQP